MAFEIGTASGYLDVLTKLRDFLVNTVGWEQIGGQTGAIASDDDFVSLKGTGLSGTDQIFVSLRTFSAPINNAYAIGVRGHTAYVSPGLVQPGANSPYTYILMHNLAIDYWFVGNGRRFMAVLKTGSRYDAMYIGFILPEHLPSDWSYPLLIAGSSYVNNVPQSNDNPYHTNFWNPLADDASNTAASTAYLFSPMQNWVRVRNAVPGTGLTFSWTESGRMSIPWARNSNQNYRRLVDDTPYLRRGQLAAFGRNTSNSVDNNVPEGGQFYGSYDGVYYTPAFGATAEQEVVVGGVTHVMFPNVGRTGDGHFAALALE